MTSDRFSRATRVIPTALMLTLLLVHAGGAAGTEPVGPMIPLPPEIAKDLAMLGEGVVGKAVPAPPMEDFRDYLNLGPGTWEYHIVAGGDDGAKVRTESYEKMPDKDGAEIWQRKLGSEYVEYLTLDAKGGFGKHLEDDVDLGYTSRFLPGVTWLANSAAGTKHAQKIKIEAFKSTKPDHVSYDGTMQSELSYIGAYEVTTPAGTWPAALVHAKFTIDIGPAKVEDSMYAFYVKGLGKVAEIESTRVSALLIYHSNTKVAKVLKSYPKH
jgi:hypothetical protein